MDLQHSIWIIKWQAKHINGWQTGCVWPGAREELELNSFPHSVNPRTGNTSVARGRAFHQHNVRHCLRQMLCWDVLLTITTFWREAQACWYVQSKEYFAIKKKKNLLFREIAVCYAEQLEVSKQTKKKEQKIFSGSHWCFLHFSLYMICFSTDLVIQRNAF